MLEGLFREYIYINNNNNNNSNNNNILIIMHNNLYKLYTSMYICAHKVIVNTHYITIIWQEDYKVNNIYCIR